MGKRRVWALEMMVMRLMMMVCVSDWSEGKSRSPAGCAARPALGCCCSRSSLRLGHLNWTTTWRAHPLPLLALLAPPHSFRSDSSMIARQMGEVAALSRSLHAKAIILQSCSLNKNEKDAQSLYRIQACLCPPTSSTTTACSPPPLPHHHVTRRMQLYCAP